ncbi:MAG: acetyl-CoA acetyltransferase [Acidimicrobiales bacterium]
MGRTLRGSVAVVGIGESAYYKRSGSPDPEFVLALRAILAACADAGIDPRDVDGFASYAADRNEPTRLAAALGTRQLRFANMQWGGGGGGGSGAVANAAAAVATGMAECVVVFRALAQGQFGRFGGASTAATVSGNGALSSPYGLMSAAQQFAMRAQRLFHEHGVAPETQRAVALASYHHAQQNPRAVMHGRPLNAEAYDESRWIVEPWRLFDCCQENDGAAALIVVPAERAADFPNRPVYLLGAAQGAGYRESASVHNAPHYASACFEDVAPRLYEMAQVKPADVDVTQAYENFTGGVVMALIEHGLCTYESANEVLQFDNLIAPTGSVPINTSGGNLAECYVHGFELQIEAVRQLRGQSSNQVRDAKVGLVISGPMVTPATDLLFGTAEALA